jgi:cell wall assembly regulator SMI1
VQSVIQLAAALNTSLRPPATEEELTALENELGYPLPSQVRDLYHTTNGLVLNAKNIDQLPQIMTISQIREFLMGDRWDNRYLPLTENNTSNHFCVRCDDLMAGYVIYVPHDDGPHVCFRDINTFLDAIGQYYSNGFFHPLEHDEVIELEEGESIEDWLDRLDFDQMPSQFTHPERLPQDIETAHRLIASVKDKLDLREADHAHAVYFALWLLSDPGEIADMTRYLEISQLKGRLNALPETSAKPYLDKLTETQEAFTAHCIKLIKQMGLTVNKISRDYGQINISVRKKANWLSMDAWYLESREYPTEADFDQAFIERLKRPGYLQL